VKWARGRPTKLKDELATRLLNLVAQGWPVAVAALKCGVSGQTVLEWVRRGTALEDDDRPPSKLYVDFALRYGQARAAYFGFLLATCNEGIAGVRPSKKKGPDGKPLKMVKAIGASTRADIALKHLSRRFPEFYGSGLEQFAAIEARAEDAAKAAALPPQINIIYGPDPDDAPGAPVAESDEDNAGR
jgi:hypothetical protein